MADTGQETTHESDSDSNMGGSITKGIMIGTPLGMVLMTALFWLTTDLDFLGSLGAASLPGVSIGVFAGGFAGMAIAMAKEH